MANPDRRRALLAALLGVAASPLAQSTDHSPTRALGFMGRREDAAQLAKAMGELGYREGGNLRYDVRGPVGSSAGDLSEVARALVSARPEVLVAYAPYEISALVAATRSIPIVCGAIPDPIS